MLLISHHTKNTLVSKFMFTHTVTSCESCSALGCGVGTVLYKRGDQVKNYILPIADSTLKAEIPNGLEWLENWVV